MNANKIPYTVVLGAGESGTGAALLAQAKGMEVFVSDYGQIKDEFKAQLQAAEIPFEEGQHSIERIVKNADLVIKSPGIPDSVPVMKAIFDAGIEVVDEIEFASRYSAAKLVAVTGSNGKTTTTLLIHHIMMTAGLDVGLAGNVGHSFAKQVAEGDHAFYALEVSSFQLDHCTTFVPDIAVLTNITADHLDRYAYKLENYIAAKMRIAQNKGANQLFIYNGEDKNTAYGLEHFYEQGPQGLLPISMDASENEELVVGEFRIRKADLTLQGRHNYFNIRVAVTAAQQLGIHNEAIKKALMSFQNDPHRMESVVVINEVEYINDSKATNVDAVFYALDAMTKPIVWIAGGIDKGNDYEQIMELVKDKVRAIICIGKDNSKLKAAFQPVNDWIAEAASMQEAIKVASLYAEPGDVVLLSPACSSFDRFENYKKRGEIFKNILLQQHKIITKGTAEMTEMKVNLKVNPNEHKTDE